MGPAVLVLLLITPAFLPIDSVQCNPDAPKELLRKETSADDVVKVGTTRKECVCGVVPRHNNEQSVLTFGLEDSYCDGDEAKHDCTEGCIDVLRDMLATGPDFFCTSLDMYLPYRYVHPWYSETCVEEELKRADYNIPYYICCHTYEVIGCWEGD